MFFKLSLRNVRKSYKNYLLYFLTLTFGVCIFYVFNSIEAQQAMLAISEDQRQMLQTLTKLMGVISVFVSLILGFLIIGSNQFLIRRRKKELGIYMTLGMGKGKIARLLVIETLLIGVFSLAAGLGLGVFVSQWMSVFTASLFEVNLSGYVSVFSFDAFMKTILYFGMIFVVVMAMSTILISRYKLIDLIEADRKNERQKLKNPVLTAILFLLSVICLGVAYGMVLKNGILMFDEVLLFEIILGSIGTFLFFASLSGFFLRLIQARKNRYYKGLNMFILRQLSSRINTAHVSISLICLMLFCTIGILSTGLGINGAINQSIILSCPNDASFETQGADMPPIAATLKDMGVDLSQYAQSSYEYSDYTIEGFTYGAVAESFAAYTDKAIPQAFYENPLVLFRLSDYNALMKMMDKPAITLDKGQVALYSENAGSVEDLRNVLERYLKDGNTVSVGGQTYSFYPEILMNTMSTLNRTYTLALVVPDEMVQSGVRSFTMLHIQCRGDGSTTQDLLDKDFTEKLSKAQDAGMGEGDPKANLQIITYNRQRDVYLGTKVLISFIGIYLGIIFLITSAAILALQQLSQVADNRRRYAILKKIGADSSMINRSIFKQTAIYFLLPLALACVHSVVGLTVANQAIVIVGQINVLANIIITALVIALIYGSYFLATYFGSKGMIVKDNIRDF